MKYLNTLKLLALIVIKLVTVVNSYHKNLKNTLDVSKYYFDLRYLESAI
jgi:hypothetical protein